MEKTGIEKVQSQREVYANALLASEMYRTAFGMWMYEHFDELVKEYQEHGHFLDLETAKKEPSCVTSAWKWLRREPLS